MNPPVLFTFGLHLHQPVGNFDSVFAEHLQQVYRPLLAHFADAGALPVTVHLSGPLVDWLERHAPDWLDVIAQLVDAGRCELLASGYDEPILASLPREDRLEQIGRMREMLLRRFGAAGEGLWLTERVWEPDLPADLAAAGIRYALVDDRHFLITGAEREALHRPFITESDGRSVGLFPIDERLRYLIPFRPPEEFGAYIRQLHDAQRPLAVLADDGEKFGGWPGTREWVYDRGWLRGFLDALAALCDEGVLRLVTFREAWDTVAPGGLVYLPTGSYREMDGWTLPARRAQRLSALEDELGKERLSGPDGTLLRGGHWRNFLVRYTEANALHKKMVALSSLCRGRGDPPEARRAIGRAQCNDAYWHGVFGGLYLPHLRHALWAELARAEQVLRRGEAVSAEVIDIDLDGREEVWVHSADGSVIIAPALGGRVTELLHFPSGRNLAAVLTRREEAYHLQPAGVVQPAAGEGTAASIHDLEKAVLPGTIPPVDADPRALFLERVTAGPPSGDEGDDPDHVVHDWRRVEFTPSIRTALAGLEVRLTAEGLTKVIRVGLGPRLELEWTWSNERFPPGARFVVELSLAFPAAISAPDADTAAYVIETVAQSEKGFDRTVQGECLLFHWPAERGHAALALVPGTEPQGEKQTGG